MARGEVLVVFDPFVLDLALFDEEAWSEREALEFLKRNCDHRMIWNDGRGKLQDAYARDLRAGAALLRRRVQEELSPIGKLRQRGGPAPVGEIRGLRSQHRAFFLAALAVRPLYIVTRIGQILPLAAQIEAQFGIRVLAPSTYAALDG